MIVELNIIASVSLVAVRLMAVKLEIMRLEKKIKTYLSPKNSLSPEKQ